MGKSEEKTGFLGNKYTQHYDDDGNKAGWSEEKTGFLGNSYTQNYNENYEKTGWSEKTTGFLGDEYTQRYDENYNKSGWSEAKETFLGDDYTQHYTEDYEKAGWSERKKDFFGDSYTAHHDTPSARTTLGSDGQRAAPAAASSSYDGETSSYNYESDYTPGSSSSGENSPDFFWWIIGFFFITGLIGVVHVMQLDNPEPIIQPAVQVQPAVLEQAPPPVAPSQSQQEYSAPSQEQPTAVDNSPPAETQSESCAAPVRPQAIDGENATPDEIAAARQQVQQFIRDSDQYQDCLIKKPSTTRGASRARDMAYENQSIKELVGRKFNDAVRAYNARTAN